MKIKHVISLFFILAGITLLAMSAVSALPFAIVWKTPTYVSDAIILYEGSIPPLEWSDETEDYSTHLYFEVNFDPPSPDTKYYFVLESSGVNPPVMWTLFFRDITTGAALDGCGAWIPTVAEKFSGIEMPGYFLIDWTFYREGTHYVSLTLKCKETATPSGTIKVMFKWTTPPAPTYTIEITNVACEEIGSNIEVYGKISPPVGGKEVRVYVTYPDGSKQSRITITSSDGTFFTGEFIANQKGEYTVQATMDSTVSNPKIIEIGVTPPTPPILTRQVIAVIGGCFIAIGVIILITERHVK